MYCYSCPEPSCFGLTVWTILTVSQFRQVNSLKKLFVFGAKIPSTDMRNKGCERRLVFVHIFLFRYFLYFYLLADDERMGATCIGRSICANDSYVEQCHPLSRCASQTPRLIRVHYYHLQYIIIGSNVILSNPLILTKLSK